MADVAARSIGLDERIDTLDLLRGVAICGILLMNIPDMGMLWEVTHPPFPFAWNRDWTADFIQHVLFAGSAGPSGTALRPRWTCSSAAASA